jgi:hypothetical protein
MVKPTGAVKDSRHAPVPNVVMSAPLLDEDQSVYSYKEDSLRRVSSAFADLQEPQRAPAQQEYAARITRARLGARPSPPALASTRMVARPTLQARMS